MKKIFVFLAISVLGQFAHADEDVRGVVFDIRESVAAGRYNALPQADQQQILRTLLSVRDQINGVAPGRPLYACIVRNSYGNYGITDMNTGEQLGSTMTSLEDCKKVLPKAGQTYACIPANTYGYYAIFNLAQEKQIGSTYTSLGDCQKTLPQ